MEQRINLKAKGVTTLRFSEREEMKTLYISDVPELDEPERQHYFKELQGLAKEIMGKPGFYHVDIFHDDWCDIFHGGYCNCNPNIKPIKEQL